MENCNDGMHFILERYHKKCVMGRVLNFHENCDQTISVDLIYRMLSFICREVKNHRKFLRNTHSMYNLRRIVF